MMEAREKESSETIKAHVESIHEAEVRAAESGVVVRERIRAQEFSDAMLFLKAVGVWLLAFTMSMFVMLAFHNMGKTIQNQEATITKQTELIEEYEHGARLFAEYLTVRDQLTAKVARKSEVTEADIEATEHQAKIIREALLKGAK